LGWLFWLIFGLNFGPIFGLILGPFCFFPNTFWSHCQGESSEGTMKKKCNKIRPCHGAAWSMHWQWLISEVGREIESARVVFLCQYIIVRIEN
jgi:hypothetical protein